MAATPIFVVDAFTDRPHAGNPAAVCLLEGPKDKEWMLRVAAEMNLAETAFVTPREGGFGLRWFTPTVEVNLCGHATLAGAHALWASEVLAPTTQAVFHTRSGVLTASRRGTLIELDFPSQPATPFAPVPKELLQGLGVKTVAIAAAPGRYLVEVESEGIVRGLVPDFSVLAQLDRDGVIVTAEAEAKEYDFVSRFFAPQSGIPEDPVTGSAHCTLAPWWGERLGKHEMRGWQASARGGEVRVRVEGDRVKLGGRAVTVLRGTLHV